MSFVKLTIIKIKGQIFGFAPILVGKEYLSFRGLSKLPSHDDYDSDYCSIIISISDRLPTKFDIRMK